MNLLVLLGCLTFAPIGFAQDTPPATDAPAPTPAAPADAPAVPATTSPDPIFAEVSASAPTNPASATAEAAVLAAAVEPTPAATVVTTNSDVLPLIQFVDVSLTSAIENLARQANLNYILDPKISFGVPDPDGRVTAAPNITIRWENITAAQALSTILKTYDLQIIDDPNSKIARIASKDPTAAEPLTTKVIQLKYASPSNIVVAVSSALTDKRSKVVTDTRTSQLVIVATEKEMGLANELIERLDTATKQVLIEAKILETTVNPKSVKGIDWSGTLKQQNVTFGNGTNASLTLNTLSGFSPATAFLNADGVNIALSFLNNSADTKVVSEPRTVTLDNQKSTIEVGLQYPIVNVSAGTANTTGGSQISYSNLTVNLEVTPRITANDFVELKVQQSILRLGPAFTSTVGGEANIVDSFFTRRIDTDVLIPSGNTLVLGGLVSDENSSANTKVPLLGDIPFFGQVFRKDGKERNRQNLIIFITPTIVGTNDFQPTQTRFLRSTGQEAAIEETSPWNSGKPYDWTRPYWKPTGGSR